jgi:hypothetical protein
MMQTEREVMSGGFFDPAPEYPTIPPRFFLEDRWKLTCSQN